ncbi:hypothetical protein HK104_008830 [Borealophlyctis nickersoniae]|nr:hypothetical protein HK104_008830 [Borealophlyctis nickersoniae]
MNQRTNPETYQPPVRSSMDAEPTVTEENQKPAPPLRKFEMMKITAPRSASFRPLRRSGSSFDLASVMKPKEPAQPVASDVNNSLPVGSVESPALSQPHAEFRAAAGTQPVTGVAQPHGEEYLPSPSLIPMTPQFPESSVSPVHYDQRPDANRFPAANTPFPAANAPKPQKLFTPRMAPRPPAIVGSSVSPTKDLRPADAVPKPHHVITPRVPPRPPAIVGSSVSPINDLRPADAAPKPHQIITPRAPEPQVGQQGERFRREVHVSKPVESVGHQQFFSIGTPDGRLNAGNIPNQPMIPVQRVPQQMQYRPPPLQLVQTHRQIAPVPAIVPKQADYALLKQEAEANIQAALAACQEIEQDEQENLKQYMELDDIDHQLQSLRSDLVDSRARIVTVMCDILLAIDPDLCNPTYKCGGTVSVSEAASDGETVKEGNDSRPQPGNDQPTETDSAMETDMQIGTPSAQVSVGQAAEQDGEMVAKEKGGRVEEEDDGVGSSMSDGDDSDSEGSQDSDLGESEDEDS